MKNDIEIVRIFATVVEKIDCVAQKIPRLP